MFIFCNNYYLLRFQGALIKEQGITFGIVVTRIDIINNRKVANELIDTCQEQFFLGCPVVLMAQDGRGVPRYYGRQDITKFLSDIPLENSI